jgi:proteic killer suppression protein
VIRSFADPETEDVFRRVGSRRLPADLQRIAYRKLVVLDAADALNDLRIPPGNRLEKLRGDRVGQYSMRINERWRICFVWRGSDAYDVRLVDYHR